MDEDWKESAGRKGALEGMRRHPGLLKAMAVKGGLAKKPKTHYRHVPIVRKDRS